MYHEGQFGSEASVEYVELLWPFVRADYFNLVECTVFGDVEWQLLPIRSCPLSSMFRLFVEFAHLFIGRNEETECGALFVKAAMSLVKQVGGIPFLAELG